MFHCRSEINAAENTAGRNTSGGAVMLQPIRFQCVAVRIWAGLPCVYTDLIMYSVPARGKFDWHQNCRKVGRVVSVLLLSNCAKCQPTYSVSYFVAYTKPIFCIYHLICPCELDNTLPFSHPEFTVINYVRFMGREFISDENVEKIDRGKRRNKWKEEKKERQTDSNGVETGQVLLIKVILRPVCVNIFAVEKAISITCS
jgi:hypothetical protein